MKEFPPISQILVFFSLHHSKLTLFNEDIDLVCSIGLFQQVFHCFTFLLKTMERTIE